MVDRSKKGLFFQVKAVNGYGSSNYSSNLTVHTSVPSSSVPSVLSAEHNSSGLIAVLPDYPLPLLLVILIDGEPGNTARHLVEACDLQLVTLPAFVSPSNSLQIKLCLQQNTTICGENVPVNSSKYCLFKFERFIPVKVPKK